MSSTPVVGAASESSTNLGDLGHTPASNAPSPRAASSDLNTPAPEAALSHSAPQAQLMSDHASTASDQVNLDGNDATASAGTYGTRSRIRPGRARPNYADDKEIDMEIEAAGKYSKSSKRTSAVSAANVVANFAHEIDTRAERNGATSINGTTHPADDTPTTSGTPQPTPASVISSKKRKQPGSGVTISTAQIAPVPVALQARTSSHSRPQFVETSMMSFSNSKARLNSELQLVADDGSTIAVNDHLYFVCEPPGEPYYFGRIIEFLHIDGVDTPVDSVRVNWFYRPKDIQRRVQDTRVVFASMHSDICPLTAFRGKCCIQHLADIDDLEEFRKQPDAFWFDKLYDRYMQRYYEVIPTSKVVNVPRHVKKILDERWKFVLVEVGRGRDLTSASKVCKRCADFAANHESVDCAVCKNTYHMSCVRPPLLRKPARGFAWACAVCSRAQELKMEARNTPMSENELSRLAEAESFDEDDASQPQDQTTRENSTGANHHSQPTAAQLAQAKLWPWRYLGIHSRPEDALDIDDRIYPRASSRLGPRHQANITVWHGRPMEFIKPTEAKKRYKPIAGGKKDAKATALLDNDKRSKRPKWVFDEPAGFIHRGHDEPVDVKGKKEFTAQAIFKMPEPSKFTERGLSDDERPQNYGQVVDDYLKRCEQVIGPKFHINAGNVDLRTKALEKLTENNYQVDKALEAMHKITARTDLKLPDLSKEEIKRFEEGVAKYGSELHLVARHVSPTIKEGRIVRFYYQWKKSPRGREIWGSFEGRKSKKDSKRVEKDANGAKLMDDVADDADDSAFDDNKASKIKRGFKCKFCFTTSSRIWRRAPATAPGTLVPRDPATKSSKDRSNWLVSALCGKCAYLWRRYAVQYESIEEIGKKIAISGGRASKRKIDEELMRIVLEAQNFAGETINKNTAQIASTAGIDVPLAMIENDESAKKKPKPEGQSHPPEIIVEKNKVVPEKPVELEPLEPEMPRVKEHPCAVCHIINHQEHRMLKCRDCRLHVHAPCYGLANFSTLGPWYCDMCKNDHNTQVSTNYECVLCPVRRTPQELMEPPKVSHKKKTDREREKERREREMVQEAGRRWREDQLAAGRPVDPREPLKRTAWNNWVHVNCAVWTKEIKFGDAERMDSAEGVGFIPRERFEIPCKFCNDANFPTVHCQFAGCNNTFHVGCAHQRRLTFGFDLTPVKMSRRDSVAIMKLGQESGLVVSGIWCAHHAMSGTIHTMLEQTPSDLTVLQEYVRTYKNVDNTTIGTVRRAAQFDQGVQTPFNVLQPPHRRISSTNGHPYQHTDLLNGRITDTPPPISTHANGHNRDLTSNTVRDGCVRSERKCCTCSSEHSPKWWKMESAATSEDPGVESQNERPFRQVSENASGQADGILQPASPLVRHQLPLAQLIDQPLQNLHASEIKPEPIDVDATNIPEELLYQCHKCHVHKKVPLIPPSQGRRNEQAQSVQVRSPRPQAIAHTAPQSSYLVAPSDVPLQPHPSAPTVLSGSHPYTNGASPWHGQSPRNGHGPAPTTPYGHSPFRPHGEFRYPYPPPPGHFTVSRDLPPSGGQSNGVRRLSSPPGHYMTLPGQAPQVLPAVHPASPQMMNGLGAYPSRPMQSPGLPYDALRGYSLQPPHVVSRPASMSVSHMTQPSADLLGQGRRPSQDLATNPGLGVTRPDGHGDVSHTSNPVVAEHFRDLLVEPTRLSSTAGPGASASPSLRNLLS